MNTSINPKRIAFQSLKRLGIDVRRSRKHPTLIDFIENRGVTVVYDVGANVGQFGTGLRQRGYSGKIFSFEPVKSVFEALKSVAGADGNWDVRQCAIGSEAGDVWVNVSANTQFSSIKSLSEKAASVDPELRNCWPREGCLQDFGRGRRLPGPDAHKNRHPRV